MRLTRFEVRIILFLHYYIAVAIDRWLALPPTIRYISAESLTAGDVAVDRGAYIGSITQGAFKTVWHRFLPANQSVDEVRVRGTGLLNAIMERHARRGQVFRLEYGGTKKLTGRWSGSNYHVWRVLAQL